MPGMIDLSTARQEMQQEALQGVLISSPENFIYTAGYTPMLLDLYRLAPLSLGFLPAYESQPAALFVPEPDETLARAVSGIEQITTFPVWFERLAPKANCSPEDLHHFLSAPGRMLPEQYDIGGIARLVARYIEAQSLSHARIGVEQSFINHQTFTALAAACPSVTFADSTALFYRLRSVKQPREIQLLHDACRITEAGIERSRQAIQPGISTGQLTYAFQLGVLEAAREKGLLDLLGNLGGQPAIAPASSPGSGVTVKYDMQVSLGRYYSDVGRTYMNGPASREQTRIYHTLLEAHSRMVDAVKPGQPVSAVYEAGRTALDRAGLRRVSRGHFGHSVGLDSKIEEPPFISATASTLLQPGMVLAVETPLYLDGIGMYQVEDMVQVTPEGCITINQLSKNWD